MAAVTCLILTAAFVAYALRLITRTPSRTPPRMTGWPMTDGDKLTGQEERQLGEIALLYRRTARDPQKSKGKR